MARKSLSPKQKIFALEYLQDLNATQAAIRAGYSEKTAYRTGCDNLKKPHIQAVIQKEMDKRAQRLEISADKVLQELAKMAFANMGDFLEIHPDGTATVNLAKADKLQLAALQEFNVDQYVDGKGNEARIVKRIRIKLADKKSNLELLARHLNLFEKDNTRRVEGLEFLQQLVSEIDGTSRGLPDPSEFEIDEL